ncbi:MAG: hypothetical protein AAFR33_08940, partial [Pseudomonadota bacterium]
PIRCAPGAPCLPSTLTHIPQPDKRNLLHANASRVAGTCVPARQRKGKRRTNWTEGYDWPFLPVAMSRANGLNRTAKPTP